MKLFLRCVASSLLLGVLFITSCASPSHQSPPAVAKGELPKIVSPIRKSSTYTRAVQTGADTYIMQTGYRVFKSTSGRGPNVELLGVIHIGEPAYYQALQKRLDAADFVMYEGVRDSTKIPKKLTPEEKAKKVAGSLYQRYAKLVGLSLQSLNMNYDRKHFQNCDMSTAQMRALLEAEVAQGGQKGADAKLTIEEFSKLRKLVGGKSMLINFAIRLAGLSDRFKAKLKFLLVVSEDSDDEQEANPLISPRCLKLITEDRNDFFLRELSRKLKQRSDVKHIVMFYGADHLSGMEKGLRKLGYVPAGPVKWLEAITSHPYAEGLRQDQVSEMVSDAQAKD